MILLNVYQQQVNVVFHHGDMSLSNKMFKVQLLNKTPWVQLLDAVVHYLPQEFTIKFTLKLMASSWTLKIQMSTLLTAIMKIFDLNVLNTVLCLKNTTMMVSPKL